MDELKPCPFCGSDAGEQDIIIVGRGLCKMVFCEKCHIDFKNPTSIEQWNTRPAEDALTTEVKRLKAEIKRMKIGLRKLWHEFRDRRRRPYIDHIEYQFYFAVEGKLETLLADDTNNETKKVGNNEP